MTLAMTMSDPQEASQAAMRRIVAAAWMAVAAGIGAQILVILVRTGSGGKLQIAGFFAEMAQGVAWSFIVCAAIAIGTLAAKARASMAGVIGLFAGPTAWAAAKGVQKGVQALAGAPQDHLTPLFWAMCGIKGLEYAALGA